MTKIQQIKKLFTKIRFALIPTAGGRTKWIYRHKKLFRHVGENLFFQPRSLPDDCNLISFGNNVVIASNVTFINHDVIGYMLNRKFKCHDFDCKYGCIKIDDNVSICSKTTILPNVHICSDVIIAAGSIVTKNIQESGVWGGIPCHFIKDFNTFVQKRRHSLLERSDVESLWENFERNNSI